MLTRNFKQIRENFKLLPSVSTSVSTWNKTTSNELGNKARQRMWQRRSRYHLCFSVYCRAQLTKSLLRVSWAPIAPSCSCATWQDIRGPRRQTALKSHNLPSHCFSCEMQILLLSISFFRGKTETKLEKKKKKQSKQESAVLLRKLRPFWEF